MDSITSRTKSEVILFVGSNPSNASTCDLAFHGSTQSSKILMEWRSHLSAEKLHIFINVLNKKTEDNRPLKKSEIKANLEQLSDRLESIKPEYVVALGKTASDALTLLGRKHYAMPHPSGRNRKLNDPEYVKEKIKGLVEFCSTSPIESFEIL